MLRWFAQPAAQKTYRLLPLALVLGASLYSTGFWLIDPWLVPAAGDYQEVDRIVRQAWSDGDLLTVRPWWAARIREYLGDRPFLQVRDLESEDLSRFARLWVVSLPGHHRLGGPFADGNYAMELEREVGGLVLRRYRLPPPARVLFNFRDQLHRAEVQMFWGDTKRPCSSWVENRWMCSHQEWNYVGKVIVELGDDPREVIWAHPSETGPLEVSYRGVPGGRTLLVHTGFTPAAARAPEDAPVTLAVSVDERELGRVVQQDRTGYFPKAFDIAFLGPGPHTVTFRVSAPQRHMRIFCFDGEVRE